MEPIPECPRCAQVARGLECLQERMREKDARIDALAGALAAEQARNGQLEKRLAALEKAAHRSAAPFRRPPEKRAATPKPAGRPKGHPGASRRPPEGPMETEVVPLPRCPHCHGPVTQLHPVEQILEELPPIKPLVKRVITYTGECARCGKVRSLHPDQVSTATGAAGVQLGPRAQALVADLRHGHGLTLRRTSALLHDHFGLRLTHGGVSQALTRMAARVAGDYATLQEGVRQSPQVYADETGWWVRGQGAWLWVFAGLQTVVYRISRKRNAAVVEAVLGERYAGVLVSDCLNVYDRYPAAQKSKCVAHHLRAIAEAQERRPDSRFLGQLRRLLGAAVKLHRSRERLAAAVYQRGVASLEARLTTLLAPTYAEKEEERIAARLRRRREQILTFLHQPEVSPTNNLAERLLRPAVITRKLSWGHTSERGARVWEILASLAVTCRLRAGDFVALMANRLRLSGVPTGLPPPSPACRHAIRRRSSSCWMVCETS